MPINFAFFLKKISVLILLLEFIKISLRPYVKSIVLWIQLRIRWSNEIKPDIQKTEPPIIKILLIWVCVSAAVNASSRTQVHSDIIISISLTGHGQSLLRHARTSHAHRKHAIFNWHSANLWEISIQSGDSISVSFCWWKKPIWNGNSKGQEQSSSVWV